MRVVTDELAHARLSHEVLVALGGSAEPVPLLLEPPTPQAPLGELIDLALRAFCLGESFAVPLFAAIREQTRLPAARRALDQVLRDEARHRQFGWDLLDALLAVAPEAVLERAGAHLPGWLRAFEEAYGTLRPSPPLEPAEREAGLLPIADYVAIHARCLHEDIGPRLRARGIPLPEPA